MMMIDDRRVVETFSHAEYTQVRGHATKICAMGKGWGVEEWLPSVCLSVPLALGCLVITHDVCSNEDGVILLVIVVVVG
jgi:hypothetical protein